MHFTYDSYRHLICLLREHHYNLTDYYNYKEVQHPCILRHDIDQSPVRALQLAKVETEMDVCSTYFVLLTSDFYNVFSAKNRALLREMAAMGHTIGLHFDEVTYFDSATAGPALLPEEHAEKLIGLIKTEAEMLSNALDLKIDVVSMHRPSKFCLESDLKIPDIINSYGQEFFKEFKYLSDSRRHWREDALSYIREETFVKLHILTHAFWYYETEMNLKDTLTSYLDEAREDRYEMLNRNFTNLDDALAGKE